MYVLELYFGPIQSVVTKHLNLPLSNIKQEYLFETMLTLPNKQ